MSSKNGKPQAERRKFQRLPVVEGLIEPITLQFESEPRAGKSQPAILTNLSAGGMSLVMFAEPPRTKRFEMVLDLPGLSEVPLEGEVVRLVEKGQTYNVGISFTKIAKKYQSQINAMALDYADCETRIALKLPEACVPTCHFHPMCVKAQKAPHWPPKA